MGRQRMDEIVASKYPLIPWKCGQFMYTYVGMNKRSQNYIHGKNPEMLDNI
jgi:hypothetical protein